MAILSYNNIHHKLLYEAITEKTRTHPYLLGDIGSKMVRNTVKLS